MPTTADAPLEAESRRSAAGDYGEALLPVLAERSAAVNDAVHTAYRAMRTKSVAMTNHAGWAAGSAAADLASVSVCPEVPTATR